MPVGESRYMEPLQLAGRLIVENGGETFRVEETVTRMGRAFGLEKVETFAVPSGLFLSYRRQNGDTETAVLRVRKGPTNLDRVNAVNAVSRQVVAGEIDCEQALEMLQRIESDPPKIKKWMISAAAAVSSAGFAGMFGGGGLEMAVAAVAAGAGQVISHWLEKFNLHGLASTLLGSFIATLLPLLVRKYTGLGTVDVIVAGALMPLLPGLAMTNAVQDTMRGDMVSGMSHALSALLTAGLIAGGALMASGLVQWMGGV